MKNTASPKSVTFATQLTQSPTQCWFDDACILEMDYFVRTLSGIKAKGVRPDLIGSFITHYASKWLPDLSETNNAAEESPESATALWMKKRFFVETLVGILPPETDSIPCNFLLRLLRTANMVAVENEYRVELEKRISWQLDQASLKEIMIPSFSHTCGTFLDVELILRLVTRFVNLDEGVRSGVELVKVGKLVDCYLAEAAVDSNLMVSEFVDIAGALPGHARATDDLLYMAIDTYLNAHPGLSKQERMTLCRLIDSRKLSPEASFHAAQNERLPVRAVIQVLFSELSGTLSGTRSPNPGPEPQARYLLKRQMDAQDVEIKKLKNELLRLQSQCIAMQVQMKRLLEKKRSGWCFKLKKLLMPSLESVSVAKKMEGGDGRGEFRFWRPTPVDAKMKLVRGRTATNWRNSMS